MQKYRRVKRNKKNAGKNVFTVFIIILTIVIIFCYDYFFI